MRNILLALLIALTLQACADTMEIQGVTYVWGILLLETIVMPIYFFGFSLYEPIGRKGEHIKGAVQR